jgi:hypothetical protein
MRKTIIISLLALIAALGLQAQRLQDNPFYKQSLERKAQAAAAFDGGDYDAAARLAAQATEFAAKSDEYVAQMIARAEARRAIYSATTAMAGIDQLGASSSFPSLYASAAEELAAAQELFAKEDYAGAKARATKAGAMAEALASAEAGRLVGLAKERLAWAEEIGAPANFAELYGQAKRDLASALDYATGGRYLDSRTRSLAVGATVDSIAKAESARTIGLAESALAWAADNDAPADFPTPYFLAKLELQAAIDLDGNKDYPGARDRALAAADMALSLAKAVAEGALGRAGARLAWAEGVGAPKAYPVEYGRALDSLGASKAAYALVDFPLAVRRANDVLEALAGVTEAAEASWPAEYVVRLILASRDCLWRIAGYPFVYNDSLKWPLLYAANKETLKNPANPDLIYPDQVLRIPSLGGELRSGTYDPAIEYAPLPGK